MRDEQSLNSTKPAPANALFYGFLALLIWAPLPLASARPWSAMLLFAGTCVLVCAWLWRFCFGLQPIPTACKKAWPIFVLLGFSQCVISYQAFFGFNIDHNAATHTALMGWAYSFIFALCLLLIDSKTRIKQTAYVLVGSALFQALFGSFMMLSGIEYLLLVPKDSYLGVATGTFVNRNSQSGYLVMCASIGIGLMLSTLASSGAGSLREHIRRWVKAILSQKIVLRLSLVMIVAGLVMTHSRMGNTSFFASLLIISPLALLLTRFNKKARRKGKKQASLWGMLLLLASLVVIDVAVVGTFFGVDKVAQRLQATSEQSETRDEVVQNAAPLIAEGLIGGLGGGSFYTAFPQVRTYDIGRSFYHLAHNDYVQFVMEFGLLGALPLGLVALIIFVCGLTAQLKRGDKLLRGMGFGAAMAILAMAIHATVDFNLQMPANAATFMVVLALGWLAMFYPSGERSG